LEFILPLIDRLESEVCQVASVRLDAGFPEDNLLSALEARNVGYVARIKKNERLKDLAAPFLQALPCLGAEPSLAFHELSYQASSWTAARRIVLVLQQSEGDLFPEFFFLLTNWSAEQMPAVALLDLYRQRGTAEGHFGELMSVLGPALSSTRRQKSHYRGEAPKRRYASQDPFAANEVKLLLNALAYNLVHAARCLLEETTGQGWSLGLAGVNYSCAAATIKTVHPPFSPARRRGRWAVGNAQRFPRGVGGCRVGGVGVAAFHAPAGRRPGVMGVRGKRGTSLWKTRTGITLFPIPCPSGAGPPARDSSVLRARG
jgi:hypothetical protein